MSRSRRIGTAWETEFVNWWNEQLGLPVVARQDSPYSPYGDVAGLLDYGFTVELKNVAKKDLGEHLTQAAAEAVRAGVPNFFLVYKKRGKGTGQAQVVIPLEVFVQLFAAYISEGSNNGTTAGNEGRVATVPESSEGSVGRDAA